MTNSFLQEEWTEKTEQIHMVIFVVSLVFLVVVMILVRMGKHMSNKWNDCEDAVIQGDVVKDRITLIDNYIHAKQKCEEQSFFTRLCSSENANAFESAKYTLEYHGLRDAFLQKDLPTIHHGVSQLEAKRTKEKLTEEFNFGEYLNSCMGMTLSEIVEINWLTWLQLWVVFIPFWIVSDQCDTPKPAIFAFIGMPYFLALTCKIIRNKLSNMREQLIPEFMSRATSIVEGNGNMSPAELEAAVSSSLACCRTEPLHRSFLTSLRMIDNLPLPFVEGNGWMSHMHALLVGSHMCWISCTCSPSPPLPTSHDYPCAACAATKTILFIVHGLG